MQLLTAGLETSAGELEHLFGRLAGEEAFDHRPCRLPMDVADHHAQADASIGKHFVHAVLLGREQADQLLPLPRNQTQFAQFGRWYERPAQQTGSRQGGQPLGITNIGLAPGHLLDVAGIDHRRPDTRRLERCVRTLPVDAGAFHDHFVRIKRGRPRCQRLSVAFEGTEWPLFDSFFAARFLGDRACRDLGLMDASPMTRRWIGTSSIPSPFAINSKAGDGGCQNRSCLKATGRQRPS